MFTGDKALICDNESSLESASNEMLMPNTAIEIVAQPRQKLLECHGRSTAEEQESVERKRGREWGTR